MQGGWFKLVGSSLCATPALELNCWLGAGLYLLRIVQRHQVVVRMSNETLAVSVECWPEDQQCGSSLLFDSRGKESSQTKERLLF